MKAFLTKSVTIYVALLLVCVAITAAAQVLGNAPLPFQALLRYQHQKLQNLSAEVLFVGDSSLGNSIDARYWEELSGQATTNLALTGAYGYGGSLAMLEAAISHHAPQKVIIMQTADMATRPIDGSAYGYVKTALSDSIQDRIAYFFRNNLNIDGVKNAYKFLKKRNKSRESYTISNDYMSQNPEKSVKSDFTELDINSIKEDNLNYIKKISAVCSKYKIECYYAHGPLTENSCKNFPTYFSTLDHEIKKIGLKILADTSPCIPLDMLGDAIDHISPNYKKLFTLRYFKDLAWAGELDGPAASPP